MSWERPSLEEIDMNAEIGGYQADDDGGNDPIVEREAADEA
jgi:hypothetical protein